uniref:MICOS complex subunit MIC13 n=1 Tax=Meleagris gallopavo TaxID=9103 RepID=G1MR01_MELGA
MGRWSRMILEVPSEPNHPIILYTPPHKEVSSSRRSNITQKGWGVCNSHRFVIKGSLAGAAVYVAYDQGLLGSGAEGAEALKKAQAALPPAVREWTSYVGWELPPTPSLDFSPSDSWNKGVHTVMSALSVAPSRACEYTAEGWKYVKDLVK